MDDRVVLIVDFNLTVKTMIGIHSTIYNSGTTIQKYL